LNLILACAIAFGSVFLLLTLLAALMRGITALFPVADADTENAATDAAISAAIATTVATLATGARVTRIEEET